MTKVKFVSINVRGIASENKFVDFCQTLSQWARKGEAHGACLQEHNLDPQAKDVYTRIAAHYHLHLAIGFSDTPAHRGGCLILADEATIPWVTTTHERPSLVSATYNFNGQELNIASVYAPSNEVLRIEFFSGLEALLSPQTIVGGDWNCVPDVLLDVMGANKLNYRNKGAPILDKVMVSLGLHDYRRDQLDDAFEHTRKPDFDSTTVLTRLDRWYVPTHQSFSGFLWDIQVRCDLVWAPTSSDHQPVVLTIEPVEGERGHDRPTIREDLIFEPDMQKRIVELTEDAYKGQATKVKKWCKAMSKIKTFLLDETKARRKRELEETIQTREKLTVLNGKINAEGATSQDMVKERTLKELLFRLQHPESPHLAKAAQAKAMTDRSEACTSPTSGTHH